MKTILKNTIQLTLVLLVIISCTLESKYGLPNTDKVDKDLIGIWTTPCIINQESDTLTIKPLNEYTYQLIFDTDEVLEAYSLKIKNYTIINIISNVDKTNIFYGYDVEKDTLRFYEVNPDLLTDDVASKEELKDFFLKNIDKHNFFMNACVMVKPSN